MNELAPLALPLALFAVACNVLLYAYVAPCSWRPCRWRWYGNISRGADGSCGLYQCASCRRLSFGAFRPFEAVPEDDGEAL